VVGCAGLAFWFTEMMPKWIVVGAALVVVLCVVGCGTQSRRSVSADAGGSVPGGADATKTRTAAPATSAPTASVASSTPRSVTSTSPPSSSARTTLATRVAQHLPIAVSARLSSDDQNASILDPSSCVLHGRKLTARGVCRGGYVPEGYVRYGDVVELYAYTAPQPDESDQTFQVVDLGSENPFRMAGKEPWTATGSIDTVVGVPQRCFVAVQATHAFMAAGNAGS
jgi:hypothetical protein